MRSPSLSSALILNSATPLPRTHRATTCELVCPAAADLQNEQSRTRPSTSDSGRRIESAGVVPRRKSNLISGTEASLEAPGRDYARMPAALTPQGPDLHLY